MANVVRPSAPSIPRKVPLLVVANAFHDEPIVLGCGARLARLEDELQMVEPEVPQAVHLYGHPLDADSLCRDATGDCGDPKERLESVARLQR